MIALHFSNSEQLLPFPITVQFEVISTFLPPNPASVVELNPDRKKLLRDERSANVKNGCIICYQLAIIYYFMNRFNVKINSNQSKGLKMINHFDLNSSFETLTFWII